jgi:serine/threonine protein kinase/formylglycine-generating enzyme required for sulfatase activity
MSDELADDGGERSESQSALIDETCSRFETACRTSQQPRIEDFLPNRPDKSAATQRSLLAHLVGIDLEWRWKTAATPAESLPVAQKAPLSEGEEGIPISLRPRLADYVARYPSLGAVEQLPNDLVVAEYYARRRYGDRPTHSEYLIAFGARHPHLEKQLQVIDDGMDSAEVHASDLVSKDSSPLGAPGKNFGDYTLLEKLGEGGMGVVYRAQHRRMKRLVAVKMVAKKEIGSPDAVKRFYREVETAAKLNHTNIVQAYDAREHEGVHYLVMEYVEGKDLAAVVKQRGPLPVAQAVDYVIQAARGLHYAHKHGVVHRDIKPSNLMLDKEWTVKILDMGLARVAGIADDSNGDGLTAMGQVMGTLDYMAPEQALDAHHADARADIYSLGCTLYRLLTGRVLYKGESLMQILMAHRELPIPPLCKASPDVSPQLDGVYQKMVAKKPEDRYRSMTEVIAALETCAGKNSASAPSYADEPTATFTADGNLSFSHGTTPGKLATAVKTQVENLAGATCSQQASTEETSKHLRRDAKLLAVPRKKKTLLVSIGLGIVGIIVLSAIISVLTSKGTLEIVTDDPNVQVAVKQNGELVEVVDAKSGWKISLKSGEYELAPQGSTDKFRLEPNSVVVTRGDTVTAKVTLKPSVVSDSKSEISNSKSPPPAVGGLIGHDGKWQLPPGAPPPAVAPFDEKQAKEHQAAWAKHLGVPVEITNSIGMKLVLIPPGEFEMGSPNELIEEELKSVGGDIRRKDVLPGEGPRHHVRITRAFYLGTYLVTQEEYQRVMGANPSEFSVKGKSKDKVAGQDPKRFPVENVTCSDTDEFCSRLAEMADEKSAARRYRLPSEAQWEYACRAGSTGKYFFGPASDERMAAEKLLPEYAWFGDNSGGRPHAVGGRRASPWGLYDIYGNVWEWCQDWYAKDYYAKSPPDDPAGPPGGSNHVFRSGNWRIQARCCRSAYRGGNTPTGRGDLLGFRVSLVLPDTAVERATMGGTTDLRQHSAGATANKPSPAVASPDAHSLGRLPTVGSLIGPDGKWKLPAGAPSPAFAPFDETKAKEHQEGWAKHLGVPVEITNSIGIQPMTQQPAANDSAGSTHPAPAVDINGLAGFNGFVDGVQNGDHLRDRRNRPVPDRMTDADDFRAELAGQVLIRNEQVAGVVGFVGLHQVHVLADARADQRLDLQPVLVWVRTARIGTSQQQTGHQPVA